MDRYIFKDFIDSTISSGFKMTDFSLSSMEDAELAAPSSSAATTRAMTVSFSQPDALAELTQLTCIQKAKALADRHHVSRNAIQRQNRVCQGVQRHSFHLQQPGHRSLGH